MIFIMLSETGITTAPNKTSKVLALRGKKQVGCQSSAERGVLVTVECCMSAAGNYMPPMFVFPRKRKNSLLMDHAPPGASAVYHETGWMQTHLFICWFKKFIRFANPSSDKPVFLILDGHATHTKSIELIDLDVRIMLCIPPHCSHRMQPLDVTFMFPLCAYYEQETRKWLAMHPGRAITIHQVARLFGDAFMRTAVMETAVKDFEKTGIYPFNRNIFEEHLFAPSETTNILEPVQNNVSSDRPALSVALMSQPSCAGNSLVGLSNINPDQNLLAQPSTSQQCSSSFNISPTNLVPPPLSEGKRIQKQKNRRGTSAVLTSTPYKRQLEAENEKKGKSQKDYLRRRKSFSTASPNFLIQLGLLLLNKIRHHLKITKVRMILQMKKMIMIQPVFTVMNCTHIRETPSLDSVLTV